MTEPTPETPYPWLSQTIVSQWVGVAVDAENADRVELARCAAANWIESQRKDLLVDGVFLATDSIVMAGLIATGRVYERAGNLTGLVNYGTFAGAVLRNDPDLRQYLGRNWALG